MFIPSPSLCFDTVRELIDLFRCVIQLDWQTLLYGLPRGQDKGLPSTLAPSTPGLSLSFGKSLHIPHQTISTLVSLHAKEHPELIAVEHLAASITYDALERQSDALATLLRSRGLARGERVCLLVQRSVSFVIGVLAILKSGAAYIPLDGGIVPNEILDQILSDAKPRFILASAQYLERASGCRVPALNLDAEIMQLAPQYGPISDQTFPGDEAYVIYTSGTTGKPKGVSVSHTNIVNLVSAEPGNLGIRPGIRISQLMNVAFDMCAWEMFASLTNGGTLVLRPSGSFEKWAAIIQTVHVIVATPSILSRYHPDEFPDLLRVAIAGERCSQELADTWSARKLLFNCCGPTEVTIINTAHQHCLGSPVSIGKPTPNNSVYVLDHDLSPLPIGSPGVLWAGGLGISAGYINLAHLTREKFRPDPFVTSRTSVMYNTGDIGRQLPDGSLEHLGRLDDQVKIKGFRVELDGVAAALESCPGILTAAVLYVNDELWGIYTKQASAMVDDSHLKSQVALKQPYYAVPTRFLALDTFPLSSNGKVDKSRLRAYVLEILSSQCSG
ncbi:AMP-binding protein [Mycena polygramma]|nr:AMP-binding protein [Mycena polygramma]